MSQSNSDSESELRPVASLAWEEGTPGTGLTRLQGQPLTPAEAPL